MVGNDVIMIFLVSYTNLHKIRSRQPGCIENLYCSPYWGGGGWGGGAALLYLKI